MNIKTKKTISALLPLSSILIFSIIFLTLRTPTTGLAGYIDIPLYRLNGSIAITLQDRIPADSYVNIKIDNYEIKLNIVDFLKKADKPYNIYQGEITTDDTYTVDFDHLGIVEGFEKGKHKITIEIVHDNKVLYRNKEVIEV